LLKANTELAAANRTSQARLSQYLDEEKQNAASERAKLLEHITSLVTASAATQEGRVSGYFASFGQEVDAAGSAHSKVEESFSQGMDEWTERSKAVVANLTKSRDSIKTRIKTDFSDATAHATSLKQTTSSVHETTIRIVSEQMSHMDTQLTSMDEIVSRIRTQNDTAHHAHVSSLSALASTVHASYDAVGDQFTSSFARIEKLGGDVDAEARTLRQTLSELGPDSDMRQPLRKVREIVDTSQLQEYISTGETPARVQYDFPTTLPRTESHDQLLARLRGDNTSTLATNRSPSKAPIYNDATVDLSSPTKPTLLRPLSSASAPFTPALGLRELDINVVAPPTIPITLMTPADDKSAAPANVDSGPAPPLKRQNTHPVEGVKESKLPMKRGQSRMTVAGIGGGDRENLRPDFGESRGAGGRRLRSRGSD